MYVEKIATVSNFQELVKDWEINLRHDKGFEAQRQYIRTAER
jgi:hypothetical protein